MFTQADDTERPGSRRRFYNFLGRSRSRSNSSSRQPVRSSSLEVARDPPPDVHHPANRTIHSSLGRSRPRPSSSSSEYAARPSARLPSRPLSTITASTSNTTTINAPTPQTVTPIETAPIMPPAPLPLHSPRPSTPTSKSKKNIFRLLSSPRRSRPTSPVPPARNDPMPSISLAYRATSPIVSVETKSPLATSSSKLQIFRASRMFSNSTKKQKSPAMPIHELTPQNHDPHDNPLPHVSATSLNGKNRHVTSPKHHIDDPTPLDRYTSRQSHHSTKSHSSQTRPTSPQPPKPRAIPYIIQTPPTPQRPSSTPPRLHHRKDSAGSQHRALNSVSEERSSRASASDGHGRETSNDKGKIRQNQTSPTGRSSPLSSRERSNVKPMTTATSAKERKHGSFNFERPSWTSSSLGARPNRTDNAPLTRVISAGDTPSSNDRHLFLNRSPHASSRRLVPPPEPPSIPDCHTTTVSASSSQQSHSQSHSHSTHKTNKTTSTGPRTSSWGRMMGRKDKSKKAPPSHLKSSGITHGQFDFEPAVPSPTGSHGHNHHVDRQEAEEEARRIKAEERAKEREKERQKRERDRLQERARRPVVAPEPPPSERVIGFRSGAKGRSLDLGLGLSWAPRKVREDALLPSFSRSLSGSGSSRSDYRSRGREVIYVNEHGVTQRHPVASTEGHNHSRVGRDMAEMFKKALDDSGYIQFQKYVHQFDAHEIPFDGSTGIIGRVERLLDRSPGLSSENRQELLNSFIRIVLQNA